MVVDVINSTLANEKLSLTPDIQDTIDHLKDFLFERLYEHPNVRAHDAAIHRCLYGILNTLNTERDTHEHYIHAWLDNPSDRTRSLVDYVAGMTDIYALRITRELMLPVPWPI
jgi:dGTPase